MSTAGYRASTRCDSAEKTAAAAVVHDAPAARKRANGPADQRAERFLAPRTRLPTAGARSHLGRCRVAAAAAVLTVAATRLAKRNRIYRCSADRSAADRASAFSAAATVFISCKAAIRRSA